MEEKELELRDYLEVIVRRKNLIIIGTIGCLLVSLALTLIMPKTYDSAAVFRNAFFNTVVNGQTVSQGIINNAEVPALFSSQQILNPVAEKFKQSPADLAGKITVENLTGTNLFTVKIKTPKAGQAQPILFALIQQYFNYGQPMVNKQIKIIKENIAKNQKDIEGVTPFIKKLEARLPNLDGGSLEALIKTSMLRGLVAEQRAILTAAKEKKAALENELAINSNFEIINPPSEPRSFVRAKLKKNLLMAGLLGLVFFIYLAFFLEYWEKSATRIKK